jgi:hypothetical protein
MNRSSRGGGEVGRPPGFTYAFARLHLATKDLLASEVRSIKRRLENATNTLIPAFADDFPHPLNEEYAAIFEALTWLPGDEVKGASSATLDAMTEKEAYELALRIISLYVKASMEMPSL